MSLRGRVNVIPEQKAIGIVANALKLKAGLEIS